MTCVCVTLLGGMALLVKLVPFLVLLVKLDGHGDGDFDTAVTLRVDAGQEGRPLPSSLFGIFFEEINHAGGGGLWAELVSNREAKFYDPQLLGFRALATRDSNRFEAGGENTPSNLAPWYPIGNQSQVRLESERSSCFERNPIALRMEVLTEDEGGMGIANPGFWGMDVRAGHQYQVVLWLRSSGEVNLSVSFISEDGLILAKDVLFVDASVSRQWHKQELLLEAHATDHNARLALTSSKTGVIWLDQVSAMPVDTYKGHGFRKELALMLEDLKPGFVRFPGGCYVEGERLQNAWRWRESVGPWQERPGHLGDKWGYWSDDGLGFFELLQLAEDLNASPVWVFNSGISHTDQVEPSLLGPFVQDILDGIEFARGSATSMWGALRAEMGHPKAFNLHYIAIGNENCGKTYYQANYLRFYNAIKEKYPDINLISNCDGTSGPLDHPADLYDYHIYTSASNLFSMIHKFDHVARDGPKVFVSEYAVTKTDAGHGSLLAALAEAAFLIGLELNSDVVEMASYAPLFVNENDRRWNPDAIVFNSWQQYGTPSYWMQHFFKCSNGARLLPFSVEIHNTSAVPIVVSALRTQGNNSILLKAVNFGENLVKVQVLVEGLWPNAIDPAASTLTVLSGDTLMEENSFAYPNKVVPKTSLLATAGTDMEIVLPAYTLVALDLQLATTLHADM